MRLTTNKIAQLRDDLTKRLEIKADMLAMGERIAFGSDSAIMRQAADTIRALATEVLEARAENDRMRGVLDESYSTLAAAFNRIRDVLNPEAAR